MPTHLDVEWKGLAQIVRIERRRELKDRRQRQVIYAITSLPRLTHGAIKPLALARDHGHVENRLFHVRDVTFGQDRCRVRTANAPQAPAHLRDAALTIIRKRKLPPTPAREAFAANPKAAIREILRA